MNYTIKFLPLLFILLCSSCGEENQTEKEIPLRPVRYVKVGQSNGQSTHNYTGLAKAEQEANLSFKVSGTVNSIPVKLGDVVKKGQLLATLDASDYKVSYNQSIANVKNSEAQTKSAEAQLESSFANFQSAESNYKRMEKLYETNSVSLSDFEQAKSGYEAAGASYRAAQTQIEASKAGIASSKSMAQSASNQVNYTTLRAPFAGIITAINGEENELVGQGNPIFRLSSLGNPIIEIGVPENAISLVKPRTKVEVQFNSIPDKIFTGAVYEIGFSPTGSVYPVTVKLSENDANIRPGMPASAALHFSKKESANNALFVPPSAIGEDANGNFVYLLQPEQEDIVKVVKQTVTVGQLSNSGFEITTGLKENQMIASAGLNMLRNGMSARLYQEN